MLRSSHARAVIGALSCGLLAHCNCQEGPTIQKAAVEMSLTFLDADSCSGAVIGRRIPDDYQKNGTNGSTDFGSRAERTFEIRSVGTAPLTVKSVALSQESAEFTLQIFASDGTTPLTLPVELTASREQNAPPGAVVKVAYHAQDSNPDAIDLVVKSDDPKRTEVHFGLTAGRGKVQVCGTNPNCEGMPEVQFGNVPLGMSSTKQITIKNVGDGDLDLRSIKLSSNSAEFCAHEVTELPPGEEQTCPKVQLCMVLKPGETYTINVQYTPRDGGTDMGVVTIVSGDIMTGNVDVPINATGSGPAVCPCVVSGTDCMDSVLVDFGSSAVGTPTAKTVRLKSCGTEPVDVNEAILETMAGPFMTGPEYQITGPFMTGTLMPGSYSEGTITFTPSAPGEFHGGLRYTVAQMQSKAWLALVGRGATCDLQVLPMSVNFGAIASGTSADRMAVMVNNGQLACTVTAISDPSNGFTIVNKPTLPLMLAPGQAQNLTVRYTSPMRMNPMMDNSQFDVTSDQAPPANVHTVTLTANGGGAPVCNLDVQPRGNTLPFPPGRDGELNFGAVSIGYSKTLSIRLQNTGNASCTLQNYTLTTEAPMEFHASTAMSTPMTIQPGTTGTIDVKFSPHGPASNPFGLYGGLGNHVDFTVAGPGIMQPNWSISILAFPTTPSISVIPNAVDFGLITWDRPQPPDMRSSCGSTARTVNIYNTGNGAFDVNSISIDPTSDPVFMITSVTNGGATVNAPYSFTVQAGGSATVTLRFFPTRINPSPHHGLLIINNTVTMMAPVTVPLQGGGTPNSSQTDSFSQLNENKVDILWVVDDSGSMEDKQQLLADNFQYFIQFADMTGADYQVGVTTTERNDPVSGKIWACNGFSKIIKSTDPNRIAAFQCAASVTNPPNGNMRPNPGGSDEAESGLEAARLATAPPVATSDNAGLVRDDARLVVIMVSDEEDQSQGSVPFYVDYFKNQVKGFGNGGLVEVSAIAGDPPNGCGTAMAGQRYVDAVSQLNGQFFSICTQDWHPLLQSLGLGAFQLRQGWTLSRGADPSTVVVTVNGMAVAQDPNNGWTYDMASNSISFHGTAVPPRGAAVQVQYTAACNM
jgi:centrosomal CEP192-like protein